ncbi:helix-turn-helix domain-containing protein, partial [Pseudomonas sp. SIMBA_059]
DRFVLGLESDVSETSLPFSDDGRAALAAKVAAYEKSLIARAIAVHGGNLKSVYESLGISRKTLYEKMQKYELHRHMTEV